jgi:CBS domain-containing protein
MKSIKTIAGDRATITVERRTSVKEAAAVMTRHQIGAVPVLDEGRLVGIFTERDVMGRVVALGLDAERTIVGDVMTTALVVADPSESYEACLARMQQVRVRHLLVLDQGRLAGILSVRDLLAADADEKDEAITMLNAYVHYIPADVHSKTIVR